MAKPTPKYDDPVQSQRFIELATDVGAAKDMERALRDFDAAVRKVATAKREAPRKPKKRAKR